MVLQDDRVASRFLCFLSLNRSFRLTRILRDALRSSGDTILATRLLIIAPDLLASAPVTCVSQSFTLAAETKIGIGVRIRTGIGTVVVDIDVDAAISG